MGRLEDTYELNEQLGRGGMGVVYRARHRRLERIVAVKLLTADLAENEDQIKRFRQEASAVKELSHENVVRLLDYDLECDPPYLVFEHVENATSLADLVRARRAGPAPLRTIGLPMAQGLAAIHAQGFIHRDVKPGNVLIDGSGRVRIIDLGLARSVAPNRTRLTLDGAVLGTLAYMAPEQLLGIEVDRTCDVYALGLVLYELAAGQPVFTSYRDQKYRVEFSQRLAGLIPSLEVVAPDLPVPLMRVIEGCIAIEPRHRPATAGEVAAQLALALEPDAQSCEPRTMKIFPVDALRHLSLPHRESSPDDHTSAIPVQTGEPATRPPRKPASFLSRWPVVAWLGAVFAFFVMAALGTHQPHPVKGAVVGAPSTSGSPSAPASGVPSAPPAQQGRELERTLRRVHASISPEWLRGFASRQRPNLKAAPERLGRELGEHLEGIGVKRQAEAFLAHARLYFAHEGHPLAERMAVRSALCDLEVLEYFCREHGIPWPMSSPVIGCAGGLDEPMQPWTVDLPTARTWCHFRETVDHGWDIPGGVLTDRWKVPRPAPGERLASWFLVRRWPTGTLLDLTVNGRFRRVVRCDGVYRQEFPLLWVEFRHPGFTYGETKFVPGPPEETDKSFPGTWIPAEYWTPEIRIDIRILTLPYSVRALADPILLQRNLSLIPPR